MSLDNTTDQQPDNTADDGLELDTEIRGSTTRPELPDLTVDDEADAPADVPAGDAPDAAAPEGEADTETEDLRDYLRQHGIELPEDEDEGAALSRWAQSQQQIALEARQREAAAQQQLEQWQRQLAWQQQQQAVAQQQHAAQQAQQFQGLLAHWNNVPEFDESFIDKAFTVDEQGNLKVREGYDPGLLQKYEAYRNWQRQALSTLARNPQQVVLQAITSSPWLHQYTTSVVEQALARERQQVAAQALVTEMEAKFFERNADGSHKTANGGLVRTPLGNRVLELQRAVKAAGEQDDMAALVRAYQIVKNDPGAMASLTKPAKTPEDGKKRRLQITRRHAANGNGRGGSVPRQERPAAPAQNPRSGSVEEMFRVELAAQQ